MTIVKNPQKVDSAAQVESATPERTGVMRGTRRQIAVTFPPKTLDLIDATARRFGMSRAGYINRAVVMALEADDK